MKRETALFGPGGNSQSFYEKGFKSTCDAPAFLKGLGLTAYEYEAGNGLCAKPSTLAAIGAAAKAAGISMSLHAPYFISLSGVEREKREKSVLYIKESIAAAKLLGADTIVVHTGSAAKIPREEAMALAAETLSLLLADLEDEGVSVGLETMGKVNQLGTLAEVIRLCRLSPLLSPVVDFGHLNARCGGGAFPDCDSYRRVFDEIGKALGEEKAKYLHCHFSKIEYTEKGEKRHLTFADETYGPNPMPLMEAIAKEGLYPRIISESAGTQTEDALTMQRGYFQYRYGGK